MPLPQALAAKLAKRGLIKVKSSQKEIEQTILEKEKEPVASIHEEIIAEDYDDTPQEEIKENTEPVTFEKFQGWFSCPNKWNVYHECSSKCIELWKVPKELNMEYNRRRLRMLQKYPLLDHWKEILDVGMGRYYYWNTETDLVSWLPPGHPKCQVSLSSAELRKKMIEEREERMKEENDDDNITDEDLSSDEGEELDKKKNSKLSDSDENDSSDESEDEDRRERNIREKEREKEKERDRRKRRKVDKSDLDPMDPAAYSECPRGTWASGLPERNEARTGVDSTASGPLFQMRPYPNPGAVLRANAAANNGVGPKKPS